MATDKDNDMFIDKATAISSTHRIVSATQQQTTLPTADNSVKGLTVSYQGKDSHESGRLDVGVSVRNLTIYRLISGSKARTVASYALSLVDYARSTFGKNRQKRVDIIKNVDGLLCSGEIVLVVGKPGSGCTTFLRALAGQDDNLLVDLESRFNYQG